MVGIGVIVGEEDTVGIPEGISDGRLDGIPEGSSETVGLGEMEGFVDGILDDDGAVVGCFVVVGGLVDGLIVGDFVTMINGPVGAGLALGEDGSNVIVGSIVGDEDFTGVGMKEMVGRGVRDGIIDGAIVGASVGAG